MIASLCQHATRDEAVLCPFYRPLKGEQVGPCHGPNAFNLSHAGMREAQHSLLDSSPSSTTLHDATSLPDSSASAMLRDTDFPTQPFPLLAPEQHVADARSNSAAPMTMQHGTHLLPNSSLRRHNTESNMATLSKHHDAIHSHDNIQPHGLQLHNDSSDPHLEPQHSLPDSAALPPMPRGTNSLLESASPGDELSPSAASSKRSLPEATVLPELYALILAEIVLAYPDALTVAEIFARVSGYFTPAALLEFARAIRHMEDEGLLAPIASIPVAAAKVAGAEVTGTDATATVAESNGASATPVQAILVGRCVRTAVTRQGREYLFRLLIAGTLPDEARRKLADRGMAVAERAVGNDAAPRPFGAKEIATAGTSAPKARTEASSSEPEPTAEITEPSPGTPIICAERCSEKQIAPNLTEAPIGEPPVERESATADSLQEIRIAEPGPTAYAAPHGTHAHGKSGDAAFKLSSPLPLIAPTAAAVRSTSHVAAAQRTDQDAPQNFPGQAPARGERSMNERTQLHASACDRYVSLIERYLPELYTPQRAIAEVHPIAKMNISSLNTGTSHAIPPRDPELNGTASLDCGPHGPEISSAPAGELCESCGEPAQRQCPCGAQRCASHFYDTEGAQAQGTHGFCAECVDLIREQQHGEERYGVAGGA